MAPDPPKVFISYSHDSPEHARRVLGLAERLRKDGVDAHLDQYVAGTPPEGWPRWMHSQVDQADFVLLICTETYYTRFWGQQEPGTGKGVDWEGQLVTNAIYHARSRSKRFVPVFFASQDEPFIPEPLTEHTNYLLSSEDNYAKLYAFLTGQAGVTPAELGSLKTLAREPAEPLRFDASGAQASRTMHNLPLPPNPAFIGRSFELMRLNQMLMGRENIVTITGIPGGGKNQLAIEYAWEHLRDYDAVFWVRAESLEALDASLAALCQVLRLGKARARNQAVQIKAVLDWLDDHERWLLIFADASHPEVNRDLLARLSPRLRGHVLITTRVQSWPLYTASLRLGTLSSDAAARYLLDRVAKKGHNAGNKADAQSLANELELWPIALEQAVSFIIQVRWSFAKYQQQFRNAKSELRRDLLINPIIAQTLSVTSDQLSPIARTLWRITAWFAPDAIPREIFSADKGVFSEALEVNVTDLAIDKALGELSQFSLTYLDEKSVSVHRVLQMVEQESLDNDERKRCLVWACRLFNAFAPRSPDNVRTWDVWIPLWQHAETLIEHTIRYGINALPVALVMNEFGLFLSARGTYAKAEPLFERALAIYEKALAPEHPDVATCLENYASLLRTVVRPEEAAPLESRARAIRAKSA